MSAAMKESRSELKSQPHSVEPRRVKQVEKLEQPEPSGTWLAAAFAFLGCAASALITSLTLSPGAAVRRSELLVAAAFLVAMGVLCVLAHWDTNRGRRFKRYLVKEHPGEE